MNRFYAALLALAGLLPIGFVLWHGIPSAPRVLIRDADVLLSTALLVGAGTLLCLAVGGGLALLVWQAQLPRWADALIAVPYLVPPFIGATAWIAALEAGNPFTGNASSRFTARPAFCWPGRRITRRWRTCW